MKIILSGYGKMGRLIEQRAMERGHEIIAVIDPAVKKTAGGANAFATIADFGKQSGGKCGGGTVAIDFTRPDVAADNITAFAEMRIPVVTGTTGWYDRLDEVGAFVNSRKSALLWASNFSIGVNLFYRIAAYCARLIDAYGEYDAAGYEIHHNQKADSPSGTAKTLAETVLKNMKRKTAAVWDKLDRPPAPHEIHFSSLRVGAVPGVHALVFDSGADTIEIKHSVRNRDGLVSGAIDAAQWLVKAVEAGRHGVFTLDDILGEVNE
ncbi:MAG: 4-hydroxy-tetrahydrodipicolinate reductase [Spirochaetaceae bacterium]|nr:4-hydroxy-tetrahydrodipicolinate reductase [Spirochaetaceae bacterium]